MHQWDVLVYLWVKYCVAVRLWLFYIKKGCITSLRLVTEQHNKQLLLFSPKSNNKEWNLFSIKPTAMGQIVPQMFFYKDGFGIK